jgi:hypothetical protein
VGAASPHERTLGTWYSEQSELAQAATPPNARNRSDSIYVSSKTQKLFFASLHHLLEGAEKTWIEA